MLILYKSKQLLLQTQSRQEEIEKDTIGRNWGSKCEDTVSDSVPSVDKEESHLTMDIALAAMALEQKKNLESVDPSAQLERSGKRIWDSNYKLF